MDWTCLNCGRELIQHDGRRKYCNAKCRERLKSRKYHDANPKLPHPSSGRTGTLSECKVLVDLLSRGYDVFRSVCSSSSCDLMVTRNGKMFRVEVTTGHYVAKDKRLITYPRHNPANYDIMAIVLPDKITYLPDMLL